VLDVLRELVQLVAKLLAAERRQRGTSRQPGAESTGHRWKPLMAICAVPKTGLQRLNWHAALVKT
jgi:hypothetical protein